MGGHQLITTHMVLAAAQAMYKRTKTGEWCAWDLLPQAAQNEMYSLAQTALEAGLAAAPKPES